MYASRPASKAYMGLTPDGTGGNSGTTWVVSKIGWDHTLHGANAGLAVAVAFAFGAAAASVALVPVPVAFETVVI